MTFKVPPSQDPNADFDALVLAFMHQMGYESDNTKKGVKSAVKDYEAKLQAEPPQWVFDIWPSIALSVLHLAIAKEKKLPERLDFPESALKSPKMPLQEPNWTSLLASNIQIMLTSKNRLLAVFAS